MGLSRSSIKQSKLCIFGLAILIFILFILILPILFLIFTFRFIVSLLQSVCNPKLYKILPPSSAFFLPRGGAEKESRSNILVTARVNGRINPTEYFNKVSKVFESCSEGNNKLDYPELKMYPKDWLGFPFWCPEMNFSIEDHVKIETIHKEEEGCKSSEEFIAKREKEFLKEPFQIKKSPWKIILLEGKNHESILFLKFHHCLTDGVAILNLLTKCTDDYLPIQELNHVKQTNWTSLIISCIILPIIAPFKLAESMLSNFYSWYDDSTNKEQIEPSSADRIISKSSDMILCSHIKSASLNRGVSFSTILFGAVVKAINDWALQTQNGRRREAAPSVIRMCTPVPLPWARIGQRLQNHFTANSLRLQLNPNSLHDGDGGIFQMCEAEIKSQRKSVIPLLCACLFQIFGSMPRWVLSKMDAKGDIQVSNFIGPTKTLNIQGIPIRELSYNLWVGDHSPLFLSFLSYNGQISICGNGDAKIFKSKKSLQQFLNNIQHYIHLANFDEIV